MLLYNQLAFEGAITGSGTDDAVYTPAELSSRLAAAERFYVTARLAQGSGSGPTLTVALEHSNDNVNWATKSTPINAQSTSGASSGVLVLDGEDTGSVVAGAYVRLKMSMGGTNPSANVKVFITGRSSD